MRQRTVYPYLAAVGFTFLFGFSFMFSKIALNVLTPLHLLALRFLCASLLMTIMHRLKIIQITITGSYKPLIILGLIQPVCYFVLETIGIKLTTASVSGMMVAIIPVFTLILARVFLHENPNRFQTGAIILSVIGVIFIGLAQNNSGLVDNSTAGYFILLAAAISAAGYSVLSRWLSLQYSPVAMTYVMMNVGLAVFLPASIIDLSLNGNVNEFFMPLLNPSVLVAVLYLGILASVGGFFLLNYALSRLPAYKAGVFNSLTTLVAVVSSIVFLKEVLYSYHIIGGIMIMIGVCGTSRDTVRRA